MEFDRPLLPGRLIRRYKRFLADVELDGGGQVTCHCPNTGAMLGCASPGLRVWLSPSHNPRRRLAFTWEQVETETGVRVGIHTGRANALVAEALSGGLPAALAGWSVAAREVNVPEQSMRADFRLAGPSGAGNAYLEVKNVTAAVTDGVALFPDAVSSRGARHLEVLGRLASQGIAALLVYCVQRGDVSAVRPAAEIDPGYARALDRAREQGVRVFALRGAPSERGMVLDTEIPALEA